MKRLFGALSILLLVSVVVRAGWLPAGKDTSGDVTHKDGIVHIGSGGTEDYVDGDGDLYVEDEIEVDGEMRIGGTVYAPGGMIYVGYWQQNNDIESVYGSDEDYYIGYNASSDELRCGRAYTSGTAANVAFRVTASTIVCIGDAGTIGYATDSGDLYVEDRLEVDGASWFADNATFEGGTLLNSSGINLNQALDISFGNAGDYEIGYNTANDELRFGINGARTTDANVAFRITASTVVAIGDTGTMNSASDSGDLYVEDQLEVDGTLTVGKLLVTPTEIAVTSSIQLYNRSTAQLLAITPSYVGELYFDSTQGKLAVSTGTAAGSFAYSDDYTKGPNNP